MRKQLGKIIDEQVRRILRELVAPKSIGHAADPGAGIARCLDIDFGIADNHHLGGGRSEFSVPRNGGLRGRVRAGREG